MNVAKIWIAIVSVVFVIDITMVAVCSNIPLPPAAALLISAAVLIPINASALICSVLAAKKAAGEWAGTPQAVGVSLLIMLCGSVLSLSIIPTNMVLRLNRDEWRRVGPLLPPLSGIAVRAYRAAMAHGGLYPEKLKLLPEKPVNESASGRKTPGRVLHLAAAGLVSTLRMVYAGQGVKVRMLNGFVPVGSGPVVLNSQFRAPPPLAILVGRAVWDRSWGRVHYVVLADGVVMLIPQERWDHFVRAQNRLRAKFNIPPFPVSPWASAPEPKRTTG